MASNQFKGLVIDNVAAETIGHWTSATGVKGFVDSDYLYTSGGKKAAIRFPVKVKKSGLYEVRISYTPHENRSSNATVIVEYHQGEKKILVNQQKKPDIDKIFVSIGKYQFDKNKSGYVIIQSGNSNGNVVADAIQVLPANE